MKDKQKVIDRYVRVMGVAYGLWTMIWLALVAAIIVFAEDWHGALGLVGIFTVLYIWIYIRYRRNVRQAVEEYRQKTAKINKNGCESAKAVV